MKVKSAETLKGSRCQEQRGSWAVDASNSTRPGLRVVDREEKVPLHACGPRNPEDSGSLTKMEKQVEIRLTMKRTGLALEHLSSTWCRARLGKASHWSLGGARSGPADKLAQVPTCTLIQGLGHVRCDHRPCVRGTPCQDSVSYIRGRPGEGGPTVVLTISVTYDNNKSI